MLRQTGPRSQLAEPPKQAKPRGSMVPPSGQFQHRACPGVPHGRDCSHLCFTEGRAEKAAGPGGAGRAPAEGPGPVICPPTTGAWADRGLKPGLPLGTAARAQGSPGVPGEMDAVHAGLGFWGRGSPKGMCCLQGEGRW